MPDDTNRVQSGQPATVRLFPRAACCTLPCCTISDTRGGYIDIYRYQTVVEIMAGSIITPGVSHQPPPYRYQTELEGAMLVQPDGDGAAAQMLRPLTNASLVVEVPPYMLRQLERRRVAVSDWRYPASRVETAFGVCDPNGSTTLLVGGRLRGQRHTLSQAGTGFHSIGSRRSSRPMYLRCLP